MRDSLERAILRLRDANNASNANWYREQCARAPAMQQNVEVALDDKLSLSHFKVSAPSPAFGITVDVGTTDHSVTLFGYVIANVFLIQHHVRIDNSAPDELKLDPYLDARLAEPQTKPAAVAEHALTSAMEGLGWSRVSNDELEENVPFGEREISVLAALEADPCGWLSGVPREEPLPADIVPYRDLVTKLYLSTEELRRVSQGTAPWQRAVEKLLVDRARVQRLVPDNYPSAAPSRSWPERARAATACHRASTRSTRIPKRSR